MIMNKVILWYVYNEMKPTLLHILKLLINKLLAMLDKKYNYKDWLNNAKDVQLDPRDIRFNELVGWNIELPSKLLLNDNNFVNQGNTMLCVAYWTTNWVNEAYNYLWIKEEKNPLNLVNYIEKYLDPNIRKYWTYIENWPKWAKALWWIKWYSQVDTLEDIKKSIFFWLSVQTGTNKLNWGKTKQWTVAVQWSWWGHHISIVWYDDNMTRADINWKAYTWFVIVENTYWPSWWDNWRYYIPYTILFDVLFNTRKNLIVDSDKTKEIIKELTRTQINNKIKPNIIPKYNFFNDDYYSLKTQNSKNLFNVLQDELNNSNYEPIFVTIIWTTEEETITRLLIEINSVRYYNKYNNK